MQENIYSGKYLKLSRNNFGYNTTTSAIACWNSGIVKGVSRNTRHVDINVTV